MVREEDLLRLYEEWDPDVQTVTQFVEGLGISRQRLYAVLARHNVTPKTRRGADGMSADEHVIANLEAEVEFLRTLVETLLRGGA